jgi:hypothetical protein
MIPRCSATIVMGPMAAYLVVYLYVGIRAQRGVVQRPSSFLWQFKRDSYSDAGWKWHMRARWMFAAFLPLAFLIAQVARALCPDWTS